MLGMKKKNGTKKRMPVMVELPKPQPAPVVTASAEIPAAAPAPITHEMIAKRAYELWQSRGCNDELCNWLDAEAELREMLKK